MPMAAIYKSNYIQNVHLAAIQYKVGHSLGKCYIDKKYNEVFGLERYLPDDW